MSLKKTGRVFLVGAGCGDYDLITLRGKELLEQCEAVVYDSLIDDRLLDFVPEKAEKICVGKRCGKHSETQENIHQILIRLAQEGKTVVRLKGGDPFVFGRGGEEILAMQQQGIEYAVIPGISSAIAVPELSGIPVTHRNISRSFHVVTAHTADDLLPENIQEYAGTDGTLVFLMGLKHLRELSESLIRSGKCPDTPSAVISNGASSGQRIVRAALSQIYEKAENANITAPAVIVVGETAGFDFSSTLSQPLKDITVTVTGTRKFASKLSAQLEKFGAVTERLDHMHIAEYRDNPDFDTALHHIRQYDWLVLTSINGAEIFFRRLLQLGIDIRELYGIKFAVIGSGTAEVLKKRGIFSCLMPPKYTSSSLGETLAEQAVPDEKILILRAENGSPELTDILDRHRISYDDIKTYHILYHNEYENKTIDTDFVTFASSSGVKAFFTSGFTISETTKIICIGDITAKTLKQYGVEQFDTADSFTADGITDTIIRESQK